VATLLSAVARQPRHCISHVSQVASLSVSAVGVLLRRLKKQFQLYESTHDAIEQKRRETVDALQRSVLHHQRLPYDGINHACHSYCDEAVNVRILLPGQCGQGASAALTLSRGRPQAKRITTAPTLIGSSTRPARPSTGSSFPRQSLRDAFIMCVWWPSSCVWGPGLSSAAAGNAAGQD
jgi:hypothetical protein